MKRSDAARHPAGSASSASDTSATRPAKNSARFFSRFIFRTGLILRSPHAATTVREPSGSGRRRLSVSAAGSSTIARSRPASSVSPASPGDAQRRLPRLGLSHMQDNPRIEGPRASIVLFTEGARAGPSPRPKASSSADRHECVAAQWPCQNAYAS